MVKDGPKKSNRVGHGPKKSNRVGHDSHVGHASHVGHHSHVGHAKEEGEAGKHFDYGWYTQEQLEDYYDQLIGNFLNILSSIFRIICCFVVNLLSQETTPILWSR